MPGRVLFNAGGGSITLIGETMPPSSNALAELQVERFGMPSKTKGSSGASLSRTASLVLASAVAVSSPAILDAEVSTSALTADSGSAALAAMGNNPISPTAMHPL